MTLVDDFIRDLRLSVRLLARSPMFAVVAVLSLALGIGANTAIFSLADAVIFRELPVREPGRLFQVQGVDARGQRQRIHSYPFAQEIQSRHQAFSAVVAAGSWANVEPVAIESPDRARREMRLRITAVTGNYFDTLGIDPAIGRTFTPDEDRVPGAHPVAIVSHRFWTSVLGADPDVVHTRVRHNGVSYQILGVAPASFTGISSNDDPDVWVPMMMANAVLARDIIKNPQTSSLYVFGRLKPGVSAAEATTDVARVYRDVQQLTRSADRPRGEAVSMARGVQALRERFERPLLVLLAVVGLLLLIACANLAALLLARAVARRHEIAVRLSLGASRGRLLRQFLTESLLIGGLGGAAGLAVSAWSASVLTAMVTTSTRRLPIYFTADARMLTFTAGVSILAVLIFGLLPAMQANRTPIAHASAPTRTHTRLPAGRLLIAGQMALSLFLLIGAGLFVRSLGNLRHLETGFAREQVLVLMLDARAAYGDDLSRYLALFRDLPSQIDALPGVRSSSMSSASFFGGSTSRGNITYEGQAREAPEEEWPIKVRITPQFALTVGLSLVAGRTFTDRDDRRAPKVAIVSESIARRYFPATNPVGRRFSFDSSFRAESAVEIVGVFRDVRYGSLREASPYTLYLPLEQAPAQRGDLQVRTWADPAAMAAQVEQAIRRQEPAVRVVHAVTLERLVEDSIVQDRLLAWLATSFAVLALALSAVGLYGISAYGVQQRTSEIGLRLALGASTGHVQWMMLRETLVPVLAGAAIGIPAALAASGVVRALLFGVASTDPLVITAATVALIAVAMTAGYLPARRACRVDPMHALRTE